MSESLRIRVAAIDKVRHRRNRHIANDNDAYLDQFMYCLMLLTRVHPVGESFTDYNARKVVIRPHNIRLIEASAMRSPSIPAPDNIDSPQRRRQRMIDKVRAPTPGIITSGSIPERSKMAMQRLRRSMISSFLQ
jgi:hypothetical protein